MGKCTLGVRVPNSANMVPKAEMMPLKGKGGAFWEEQGGSCLGRIDMFQKAGRSGHEERRGVMEVF